MGGWLCVFCWLIFRMQSEAKKPQHLTLSNIFQIKLKPMCCCMLWSHEKEIVELWLENILDEKYPVVKTHIDIIMYMKHTYHLSQRHKSYNNAVLSPFWVPRMFSGVNLI